MTQITLPYITCFDYIYTHAFPIKTMPTLEFNKESIMLLGN